MKNIFALFFICLFSFSCVNVFSQDAEVNTDTENIKVYYFHTNYRCATCKAVEEEAHNALKEIYPEKLKNKEIEFLALNLEEDDGEKIAEKMKVNSQSLLITKGDKKEDITTFAFMNARSNPAKVHEKIKEVIDSI